MIVFHIELGSGADNIELSKALSDLYAAWYVQCIDEKPYLDNMVQHERHSFL